MAADIWATIAGERKALAGDLEGLSDEQWNTRSLCIEWTVKDVLGHMTGTAKLSPGGFFANMLRNGFSITKMQGNDIARETQGGGAATLANFKAIEQSRKHPPGPGDTWLGEVFVHAEDIRRALGIAHDYPMSALTRAADFYKKSNLLIGSKKRITGLTLKATDTDWSTGSGPEVSGPMIALLMTMVGRKGHIDDLKGDGLDTLKSRL